MFILIWGNKETKPFAWMGTLDENKKLLIWGYKSKDQMSNDEIKKADEDTENYSSGFGNNVF